MAITDPTGDAPPTQPNINFVLDTGADYAQLSLERLINCGLPPEGPSAGSVDITLADGSATRGTMRDVNLWLFSNKPGIEPFHIESKVVVTPVRGESVPAVLGMNPLLNARVLIKLDFDTHRFSVWV